jgi:hypothetical protein
MAVDDIDSLRDVDTVLTPVLVSDELTLVVSDLVAVLVIDVAAVAVALDEAVDDIVVISQLMNVPAENPLSAALMLTIESRQASISTCAKFPSMQVNSADNPSVRPKFRASLFKAVELLSHVTLALMTESPPNNAHSRLI